MLTRDQAADIFSRIRKFATADEVECLFYGGHSALTRFANNTIHQNMAEENYGVSVRTVFGGRTARATTNKFDDESLKNVAKSSEDLARVQEPDQDSLQMPNAGAGPPPHRANHRHCLRGISSRLQSSVLRSELKQSGRWWRLRKSKS